jgi:hypothetical protein
VDTIKAGTVLICNTAKFLHVGGGVIRLLYLELTLVLTMSADASTVEEEGFRCWVITCGQPRILAVVVSYLGSDYLTSYATVVRHHYSHGIWEEYNSEYNPVGCSMYYTYRRESY